VFDFYIWCLEGNFVSLAAVVKGERGTEPVFKAIELIPFEEALESFEVVLVKPNLITSHNFETGVTTDPIVLKAVIKKVQGLKKKVVVVETDGGITSPDKAIVETGMMNIIEQLGVEYVNMGKVDDKVDLKVKDHRAIEKFKVARMAVESAIITVPTMKTLYHTTISMGLKNMFGMLTTSFKFPLHRHGMDNIIYDVCKTLPPTLSIIDGFYGKSGKGPWSGAPVKMDTIIASVDPVAADATAARCIGIDPHTIDHVRWLYEAGLGEISDIEIVGARISDVYQKWNRE
jgi:uncharacterized protein (DUF362 family)